MEAYGTLKQDFDARDDMKEIRDVSRIDLVVMAGAVVEIVPLMPAVTSDWLGNPAERSLPVRLLPMCERYERGV